MGLWGENYPMKLGECKRILCTKVRSGGSRLSEGDDLVDELDMGEEHPPATVPFELDVVEDLGGILTGLDPPAVFLVQMTDDLPAGEASDRYDHLIPP